MLFLLVWVTDLRGRVGLSLHLWRLQFDLTLCLVGFVILLLFVGGVTGFGAIEDLLNGDALREVQLELVPLILLEDRNDVEQDLSSLHRLDDQVGLALLQLQSKDFAIILVQHDCLNRSQIDDVNNLIVSVVLHQQLINLIIILVSSQEEPDPVLLLVVDNQELSLFLVEEEDVARSVYVVGER